MVDVTRTFQVPHPRDAVREYLQDFARAQEWDPGTVSCEREGSGPVQVGARWHNVVVESMTEALARFRGRGRLNAG